LNVPAAGARAQHEARVEVLDRGLELALDVGQVDRHVVKELCLRLQQGCGVRGWGRDGLGTGA
jgi:hypothetical protein